MAKFIVKIFVWGFVLALAGIYFFGKQKSCPLGGGQFENEAKTTAFEAAKENDAAPQKPITILAFGDLLMDRYIKLYIDRYGAEYPFKNLKEVLANNDFVLANLEGSFTGYKPRPLNPNNTSFTFDPALVATLKENGFNVLSLANNHVRDFGKAGFEQSQRYLADAGVDYFGDYHNENGALTKEVNGLKIAFVGYHSLDNPATEGTIEKVKTARQEADFVIVCAHWGAEYQNNFSKSQQESGRQFIDAGADVVLGSHPHVIQPIEIYRGKPIFYSLGNFLFDQIFSFEVRHGLGVKIIFAPDKVEYELIPTQMKDFQVVLPDKETKSLILLNLASSSIVADDLEEQITAGRLTLLKI